MVDFLLNGSVFYCIGMIIFDGFYLCVFSSILFGDLFGINFDWYVVFNVVVVGNIVVFIVLFCFVVNIV